MGVERGPQGVGSAVGHHGLGPHVVGQRVVVRRVVRGETGPSGGPALTDVLGVCTAWGDGVCVLVPVDGTPVTIALADIVSGKPVPPRPSVRDRVPAVVAQRHGFALFPDLVTEPLGDWVLRDSPTATARRANSVLAFGPSGVDDDVDRVVAHYPRPVAAVLSGSEEDRRLRDLGWVPESHEADTLFQVAGVAQVARRLRGDSTSEPLQLDETSAVVTARIGAAASGTAAYADDWVGFRGLDVDPAHRRSGLARQVMAALVDWGAERGATTAYLQVLASNAPAIALYADLGFRTHHTYRYLTSSLGQS